MAQHLFRFITLFCGVRLLLLIPPLEASPWFWPWNSRSNPSIINISIGNRFNTSTNSSDAGTTIRDLTFNLSQWRGNLTFEKSGADVSVTRGNDGTTTIHIDFDSDSISQRNSTNSTSVSNSTGSTSRKKRAIFPQASLPSIPVFSPPSLPSSPIFTPASLPSIPIPTLNDTQALLNGNFLPLPSAITNLGNNARTFVQPWQYLQNSINSRLPMQTLDTAVSFLSQLYSSTVKSMLDTGITTLNATLKSLSGVVNSGLNTIEDQADSGIRGVSQLFKALTQTGQSCVGQVPDDATVSIVNKSTGCVRERWNELEDIANQFLTVVSDTEEAYGGWLRSLNGCTASNFVGIDETALDTAQRNCYVQTIANSVGKLVDIPMRWANLTIRTSNAITNFQPQVGLCVAGVGVEVASVSARIGLQVVLCQFVQ
ncbi:uncharacterized protein LOC134227062 [Armigeres subalbatus]|uniref:uncharacterized protein LOC134227062 n=1 Tax=Armigeres subalbatus TaxID=124917 RepID=UPI002ED63DE1